MKQLVFGEDARKKLKEGVDAVAKAVAITLGPSGRNVIISDYHGDQYPSVTKDGVSVARSIQVEDPLVNVGVEMIKNVAKKTVDDAGDGTTTATVLAACMIGEGLKMVSAGSNSMDIKRGMDKAVAKVVERIKEISQKIDGDADKIKNVATVSANNDSELGNFIAEAFGKIGDQGVVDVEESMTSETTIRVVEGMQIDKGYMSKYFVTDPANMEVIQEDVMVIVTDADITLHKEIAPLLEKIIPSGKPILIVCSDLAQEAMSFVTINKMKGGLKISAIKPASAYRPESLADIAAITGATVISDTLGTKLENATLAYIGHCAKVVSTELTTRFIGGSGKKATIEVRKEEIKALLANAKNPFDIERLKKRLARISEGVAIMSVGAATEVEMNEKMDRVDDAIRATRSALEEGIVPGGGVCLLRCIDAVGKADLVNEGEKIGGQIILKSLEAPLRQILANCGITDGGIIEKIKTGESKGYNARTMKEEDLLLSGVIDPAKVVRVALENACSVAGMVITSECLDAEIHRKGPLVA
ncbi:MAG: chaperonin GroEL [Paludibacter sp.]|nr:chaperonin GroEL [Paludibacter sp.]